VCARTVLYHQGTKDSTKGTKESGFSEPQSQVLLFFVPLVTFVVGPSVEPPNRQPAHRRDAEDAEKTGSGIESTSVTDWVSAPRFLCELRACLLQAGLCGGSEIRRDMYDARDAATSVMPMTRESLTMTVIASQTAGRRAGPSSA